jgi:hypothetical protein
MNDITCKQSCTSWLVEVFAWFHEGLIRQRCLQPPSAYKGNMSRKKRTLIGKLKERRSVLVDL